MCCGTQTINAMVAQCFSMPLLLNLFYVLWEKWSTSHFFLVLLSCVSAVVVEKVRVGHLPVYPAGASAGTDGRWWRCVIGICVDRRGGNTQHSFPLSCLCTHTQTHTHTYPHTHTNIHTLRLIDFLAHVTACHSFFPKLSSRAYLLLWQTVT